MNRGQAKRPVFFGSPEIRYFQARLAREVRRGEIEVVGYCFLTTHFHLLLRSTAGRLSDVMRRVENPFVRWFNRRHKRDGALFRGRFTSRRIDSEKYFENVVKYIDNNAVAAGLVTDAADYPHGSAWFHRRSKEPLWLKERDPGLSSTSAPLNEHASWVVERCLERQSEDRAFDDLIGAAPLSVRRWMEHKTRVADGPQSPHCLISPAALRMAVEVVEGRVGPWSVTPRSREKDGWQVLEVGLSREVVGLSTLEAAVQLGVARSSAGHALLEHRRLVLADAYYAERAAEVLHVGLSITFGGGKHGNGVAERTVLVPDERPRSTFVRD